MSRSRVQISGLTRQLVREWTYQFLAAARAWARTEAAVDTDVLARQAADHT